MMCSGILINDKVIGTIGANSLLAKQGNETFSMLQQWRDVVLCLQSHRLHCVQSKVNIRLDVCRGCKNVISALVRINGVLGYERQASWRIHPPDNQQVIEAQMSGLYT